jgi:hypothetical protein
MYILYIYIYVYVFRWSAVSCKQASLMCHASYVRMMIRLEDLRKEIAGQQTVLNDIYEAGVVSGYTSE